MALKSQLLFIIVISKRPLASPVRIVSVVSYYVLHLSVAYHCTTLAVAYYCVPSVQEKVRGR